ncbi:DUF1801 domain-containing protein [Actinokineospora globicatena]|uniref:YdhG-like domain-containing protein n=1 Tax=Actinokineospora globicatena TaxID=103729 RepID=A0A9W6QG32_9PSEU|nr:DUF1801 domain-containing protein [Actinokineospora globicatena]GLW89441.1 hypothetical protein Aglo03_02570 [Actinokineospora globicatena]
MTTVAEYNAALPADQREIADALTALIEAVLPGTGAVWHGHPVWSLGAAPGKQPVCLVKAYPRYVTFGLWRGQELADPSGLVAGSRAMASIKVTAVADIDAAQITTWLQQARALEA